MCSHSDACLPASQLCPLQHAAISIPVQEGLPVYKALVYPCLMTYSGNGRWPSAGYGQCPISCRQLKRLPPEWRAHVCW